MKYVIAFLIALLPISASADVALFTFGDDTSIESNGPIITLCTISHDGFLQGNDGSWNGYYELELGHPACGDFDINDDYDNIFYHGIENNTNITSGYLYVCPSHNELTLDDTLETGCDGYEPTPTSTPVFNSATSTEALLGSISFGIAVIICLLFLMVIGFVWNNMTRKKPWL